ncbi:phosphatidate cytidylyltransferase [Acidobacteriota bacterium]
MSLKKRTLTAMVLLIFVFVSIQIFSRLAFFLVLQAIILAALLEFYNLTQRKNGSSQRIVGIIFALILSLPVFFKDISLGLGLFVCILLAAVYFVLSVNKLERLALFPSTIALTLFGALYLSFTLNYFFVLREEYGPLYIYFLLSIIFVGDTGAYFFGSLWGRRKLAPLASPNKTWEGSFGGIVCACAAGLVAGYALLPDVSLWKAALCAFLVHAVAQISDPLESLFKRAAGVKDSSNLLPGHGGFLDRVDSLILAAPLFYYLIKLFVVK